MALMSLKIVAPFIFVVLLGAGCAAGSPEAAKVTENNQPPTPAPAADHATDEHIAKLAGSRVDLKGKNALKPGTVELSFTLYGEDGHAFGPNDLKIEHEKKMHLLLVRDDMTRFQHLHPEFVNAAWTVKTTIPDQGNYQMYVDIAPVEEKPSVLRVPLAIGGQTQSPKTPEPNADWSAQDGPYTAKLVIDQPLKTKETKRWTFLVTQNGQPVTTIKPYLGAYGHVVELRHNDPDDFFHVHPVTEDQPRDGKVVFEGTFPTQGRYTLYAQFNLPDGVRTFPITVDVQEDGEATPSAHPSTGDASEGDGH